MKPAPRASPCGGPGRALPAALGMKLPAEGAPRCPAEKPRTSLSPINERPLVSGTMGPCRRKRRAENPAPELEQSSCGERRTFRGPSFSLRHGRKACRRHRGCERRRNGVNFLCYTKMCPVPSHSGTWLAGSLWLSLAHGAGCLPPGAPLGRRPLCIFSAHEVTSVLS